MSSSGATTQQAPSTAEIEAPVVDANRRLAQAQMPMPGLVVVARFGPRYVHLRLEAPAGGFRGFPYGFIDRADGCLLGVGANARPLDVPYGSLCDPLDHTHGRAALGPLGISWPDPGGPSKAALADLRDHCLAGSQAGAMAERNTVPRVPTLFTDRVPAPIRDYIAGHELAIETRLARKAWWAVENCNLACAAWTRALRAAGFAARTIGGYYLAPAEYRLARRIGEAPGSSDHVWLEVAEQPSGPWGLFDPTAGQFAGAGPIQRGNYRSGISAEGLG
jgi:hypothetical protein